MLALASNGSLLNAGTVTPGSAGGSFNAAAPGAIGGTTSNTVQATQGAFGASVPALPGVTGGVAFQSSGATAFDISPTSSVGNNDVGLGFGTTLSSSATGIILDNQFGVVAITGNNGNNSVQLRAGAVTEVQVGTQGVSFGASLNGPGPLVGGASSFCMGTSASIAAATTDFIACGENPGVTVIATEANDQMAIPAVCTISNLYVKLTTAANTNVPVITVDKNTTGQTLTCTVLNTATVCQDTTHSFTTAVGDLLSIKLANPTSANATGVVYAAFQISC